MTKRNFETLEVGGYYKSRVGHIHGPHSESECCYREDGTHRHKQSYDLIEKVDIVPCPMPDDKKVAKCPRCENGRILDPSVTCGGCCDPYIGCDFCMGEGYVNAVPEPTTEERRKLKNYGANVIAEELKPLIAAKKPTTEESSAVESTILPITMTSPVHTIDNSPNSIHICDGVATLMRHSGVTEQKPRKFKIGDWVEFLDKENVKFYQGRVIDSQEIKGDLHWYTYTITVPNEFGRYRVTEDELTLLPIPIIPKKFKVGDRVIATSYGESDQFIGKIISYVEGATHNVVVIEDDRGDLGNYGEELVELIPVKLFVGAVCKNNHGNDCLITKRVGKCFVCSFGNHYKENGECIDYDHQLDIIKVLNREDDFK